MISAPVTGVRALARARSARAAASTSAGASRPGLAKLPVSEPEQLVEVGAEDAVGPLLDAEVLEHRDARRAAAMRRAAARIRSSSTPQRSAQVRDVARARAPRGRRSEPVVCSARKPVVEQALLNDRARQRRQAPGVAAGPHAEVEVGHLGRLGARPDRARSSSAPGRVAISRSDHAGAREALRLPRVLADEDRDLGVLEVAARVTAVEVRVDVDLARLLLRERARAVARAERAQQRRRCRRRRGGSPGRRRRSRRSTRRRARRGPAPGARRPRRSPCPSRSPRSCRPARRRSG